MLLAVVAGFATGCPNKIGEYVDTRDAVDSRTADETSDVSDGGSPPSDSGMQTAVDSDLDRDSHGRDDSNGITDSTLSPDGDVEQSDLCTPTQERCDGVDNDCDNRIDESPNCTFTTLLGGKNADSVHDIEVDPRNGDVVVTAVIGGNVTILKYQSDGTQIWKHLISPNGAGDPEGLAVSKKDGAIYVVGEVQDKFAGQPKIGFGDVFLLKFTSKGKKVWARILGTSEIDEATDLELDRKENALFISGRTNGDLGNNVNAGKGDAFVARYDYNGNVKWITTVASGGHESDHGALAIRRDPPRLLLMSTTSGKIGSLKRSWGNAFGAMLTTDGKHKDEFDWIPYDLDNACKSSSADPKCPMHVPKAAESHGNSTFVVGHYQVLANNVGEDLVATRLGKNGGHSSDKDRWDLSDQDDSPLVDIAIDSKSGHAWVVGDTHGAPVGLTNKGRSDVLVYRYDASMNRKSPRLLGTSNRDFGSAIAVDPVTQNVYIGGSTEGDLGGNLNGGMLDGFIARIR